MIPVLYTQPGRMLPGILRSSIDFFVRPQVNTFVYQATRLRRREVIDGARAAALAVNEALRSSLHDDDSALDELSSCGALDGALHAALRDEIERGRLWAPDMVEPSEYLVPAGKTAIELQLEELTLQRQALKGEARLDGITLVVGADRDSFSPAMHQLKIGTCLVVLGTQPSGLWRTNVQRELMGSRGCSVQCSVAFAEPRPGAPDQRYTFEVAVSAERLISDTDQDEERSFSLVDLNDMMHGAQFWRTAAEVNLWPRS